MQKTCLVSPGLIRGAHMTFGVAEIHVKNCLVTMVGDLLLWVLALFAQVGLGCYSSSVKWEN